MSLMETTLFVRFSVLPCSILVLLSYVLELIDQTMMYKMKISLASRHVSHQDEEKER